jgi:hypothetical protein
VLVGAGEGTECRGGVRIADRGQKGAEGEGEEAEAAAGAVVVVSGESDAGRGAEQGLARDLGIFCFRFLVPFAGGGGYFARNSREPSCWPG